MPWWIGPRGHLEPRLFFRRGDIVYERKWAEAKKPIHRFLDRVPLQMSSRRRRNASFWRPEIVLVVSLRKRVNAGKFRTRSQTGHFARSRRFVSVWFLIDLWIVHSSWNSDTLMRYEDWKKRSEERILHNRLSSIYKILDFWKCKNNGSLKQIFRFWRGEISRGGFCRFSIAPKTKISTYSIATLNPISTDVIPFMGIVRVQYRGSNLISRTLNQQSG